MEDQVENPREKKCEECSTPFTSMLKRARFCSGKCRAKNARKNGTSLGIAFKETGSQLPVPASQRTSMHVLSQTDPQTQVVMDILTKEASRWEDAWKEERTQRKELQKANAALKEQLAALKVDHQMEALENSKPSGLAGLADNPLVQKLFEHAAPALGAFLMRYAEGAPQQMISGTDGQLDETTQKQLADLNTWYAQLPQAAKDGVYQVLTDLAKIQNPELLNLTLTKIHNLINIKNGRSIPHMQAVG
jgi:hypothetical protein